MARKTTLGRLAAKMRGSVAVLALLAAPACAIDFSGNPLRGQAATELETPAGKPAITQNAPNPFRDPQITPSAAVTITYFGTGGYLVERGDDAVLLAPFFSHASLLSLGFGEVDSDAAAIDGVLRPYRDRLNVVEAIAVGHSHHDHLLDMPHIMKTYATHANARLYGNASARNILSGAGIDENRLVALNELASGDGDGRWQVTPSGGVRLIALASDHAPNIEKLGIPLHFAEGSVDEKRDSLPRRPRGWKVGKTLAFMIDFMNARRDRVLFRIYYQDTAYPPDASHSPAQLRNLTPGIADAGAPVDVAIVCVATANFVDDYQRKVEDVISPRHYIFGHWEDFFGTYSQNAHDLFAVCVTNPEWYIAEHEKTRSPATWVLPVPGTVLNY